MNLLAAIIITAVLCVGSFFWGGHEEAKRLEAIKSAMHHETRRALDDIKGEVIRVETEYNAKIKKMQEQWDSEIGPLLVATKKKCKNGSSSSACNAANNAVLEAVFNLKQKNKTPM